MGMSVRHCLVLAASLLLAGCVAADTGPINQPEAHVGPPSPAYLPDTGGDGSTIVGLAFSGGGTRAAAFGYGVLRELEDTAVPGRPAGSLMRDVRMVSGASGGAIAAAYFGLRGREGYRDFREKFLIRDAEAYMHEAPTPLNLIRVLNGGVNDRRTFAAWMDKNLFEGATYASLMEPDKPFVWINASDIFNGTPFLFTRDTFAALCSDLEKVRIADAVAASAAVPVVFTPIVVDASQADCGYKRPEWLDRAMADPDASLRLKAIGLALESYQEKQNLNYVKLLDGGLTDNIGVTALTMRRSAAGTPYGPLSPTEAAKLRTLIFLVADAGQDRETRWAEAVEGPKLAPLLDAVTNATIQASVRDEFDALKLAAGDWQSDLISWRCGLSAGQVAKLRGTLAGWNCRDVRVVVEHLGFTDLDPATTAKLEAVPTRLTLPTAQVDLTIEAGRQALRVNAAFQRAIGAGRGRGAAAAAVASSE